LECLPVFNETYNRSGCLGIKMPPLQSRSDSVAGVFTRKVDLDVGSKKKAHHIIQLRTIMPFQEFMFYVIEIVVHASFCLSILLVVYRSTLALSKEEIMDLSPKIKAELLRLDENCVITRADLWRARDRVTKHRLDAKKCADQRASLSTQIESQQMALKSK
jgi:cell division protein FtsL